MVGARINEPLQSLARRCQSSGVHVRSDPSGEVRLGWGGVTVVRTCFPDPDAQPVRHWQVCIGALLLICLPNAPL